MADPYTPEKSKALFGNSHMSTVMLEIASLQEDTFSPKLIIERTGLLGSVVHPLITASPTRARSNTSVEGRMAKPRSTASATPISGMR